MTLRVCYCGAIALGLTFSAFAGVSSDHAAHAAAKKTSSRTQAKSARAKSATAKHKQSASASHGVSWRNRQLQPTSDRYREIQDALVAKGLLQPEQVTGVWDQASMDALRQFQAQQNLSASGKINSLSLIALGLGPTHDSKEKIAQQIAAPEQSQSEINR